MKNNYTLIVIFIFLLLGALFLGSKSLKTALPAITNPPSVAVAQATPLPSTDNQVLGIRTKSEGCQLQGPLPDKLCTPGAVFPDVTKEQVCTPGYSSSVRNVPQTEKNQVYEEYGLPPTGHPAGSYEVDHYISLELGGSNDISNLFPEAAEPRPGYHEKDRYENFAHNQVCGGKITLEEAQRRISTNWLEFWIEAGKP